MTHIELNLLKAKIIQVAPVSHGSVHYDDIEVDTNGLIVTLVLSEPDRDPYFIVENENQTWRVYIDDAMTREVPEEYLPQVEKALVRIERALKDVKPSR